MVWWGKKRGSQEEKKKCEKKKKIGFNVMTFGGIGVLMWVGVGGAWRVCVCVCFGERPGRVEFSSDFFFLFSFDFLRLEP
jgi:hypothetical protein